MMRRQIPVGVQYSHVGRESNSVYIAGLSNGMFKVGFSDNPLSRVESVEYFVRKKLSEEVVRFEYFPASGGRDMERLCLAFFRTIAQPQPQCSEIFSGVAFDSALDAMAELVTKNVDAVLDSQRRRERARLASVRRFNAKFKLRQLATSPMGRKKA